MEKLTVEVAEITNRFQVDQAKSTTEAHLVRSDDRDEDRRRAQIVRRLNESVGLRFANAKFAHYRTNSPAQEKAVQVVQAWAENYEANRAKGAGMLLYGPPGTGKDHLAIAALRLIAIKHGVDVLWTHGLDLFAAMRTGIQEESKEAEVLRPYFAAGVLCLSDPIPPAGAVTPWQASQLGRIIDRRWRMLRPTIVTLNVRDGEEAGDRLGQAAVDRLKQDAVCVACNWASFRKAAQ